MAKTPWRVRRRSAAPCRTAFAHTDLVRGVQIPRRHPTEPLSVDNETWRKGVCNFEDAAASRGSGIPAHRRQESDSLVRRAQIFRPSRRAAGLRMVVHIRFNSAPSTGEVGAMAPANQFLVRGQRPLRLSAICRRMSSSMGFSGILPIDAHNPASWNAAP